MFHNFHLLQKHDLHEFYKFHKFHKFQKFYRSLYMPFENWLSIFIYSKRTSSWATSICYNHHYPFPPFSLSLSLSLSLFLGLYQARIRTYGTLRRGERASGYCACKLLCVIALVSITSERCSMCIPLGDVHGFRLLPHRATFSWLWFFFSLPLHFYSVSHFLSFVAVVVVVILQSRPEQLVDFSTLHPQLEYPRAFATTPRHIAHA